MNTVMRKQDMVELYQLAILYQKTYHSEEHTTLSDMIADLSRHYSDASGGMDIEKAVNPRGAGRRRKFDSQTDEKIRQMHSNGSTIREIAAELGCSIGYAQSVIAKNRTGIVHKSIFEQPD